MCTTASTKMVSVYNRADLCAAAPRASGGLTFHMAPSAWCVPLGPSTHLEGVSAHRDAEPKDKSRGWGRPGGACGGIQLSPPHPPTFWHKDTSVPS